MTNVVKVYGRDWALILHWLKENIGEMLHSNPVVFWHGEGWHMTLGRAVAPRGENTIGNSVITVEFTDAKNATWFSLVWV